MEKRKGIIEHLPACLLVSVARLEAINDDKHLTRMVLFSFVRRNLGVIH